MRQALLHTADITTQLLSLSHETHSLIDYHHDFDPHEIVLMRLCDETSKRIAATEPPSTQRQVDALKGTTEGHLIRESMVDEVTSMINEGRVLPRDIRTLDKGTREIDGKWVIKYKKKLDGHLDRVRSRWTLRGDRQIPHRDYDPNRIYSPVAAKTSHFTIFAIALQFSLLLFALDVSKAFMMGPIDTPGLLMRVPTGFRDVIHPDWCPFGEFTTWELLCSLYGLKQAAAVYYDTVKKLVLAAIFPDGTKFRMSESDPCVFVKGTLSYDTNSYTAFSMHIDDKFIACKTVQDKEQLEEIFTQAKWKFTCTALNLCLGVGISYQIYNPSTTLGGTLTFSHEQYIADAWNKFSVHIPSNRRSGNSIPISKEMVEKTTKAGPNPTSNYDKDRHKLYLMILGTVGHCANFTHPEIAYAISFASQYMANPSDAHLTIALSILAYLWHAKGKLLTMKRQHQVDRRNPIIVACDSDLSNSASRRSRTGWVAFLFGNLVGWNSRLQVSVSLSTAEAEYMALTNACQFAVWYKQLVADLGIEHSAYEPVTIFSDNQSAIHIASQPITHKHSRHIDRRLHWIKEHIRKGSIRVLFVATNDNVSDSMTKALAKSIFQKHRDSLLDGLQLALIVTPDHSYLSLIQEDPADSELWLARCSGSLPLQMFLTMDLDESCLHYLSEI